MELRRRDFLQTVGTAALAFAPRFAAADDYPSRPVRIVVGFVPGTGNDITARLIGQWLSDRLGRQFFVENRPGAASNLAVEIVTRAVPDGYTLLSIGPATTINAALYRNLSFDFLRDIAPVAGTMRVPNVMVVNPSFPAKTVPEFIAHAKANPGKINMATAGPGSTLRMFGELFCMMTGISLTAVSYRGGSAAFVDLLSGQVQVMFGPLSESIGHIRSGELRALAVTGATRSAILPDVPTVGESVPDYETDTWYGIGAPKNTPAEIVTMLNAQINAGLADAKMQERFADLGGVPLPMSPAEFANFLAEQTEKWAKVIAFAGIKPE
ncbi:MAG TPA: tripartite tricarboxylate transporter substrate binding protein [Xanthobacteraceae bacterium]|jgi:tripartite-type tricarboxylate transporter receptor subunit TctC|nr:tripartite tricarboxylate transporter substrate binding protein [Xanthobacteraceae bacterium]